MLNQSLPPSLSIYCDGGARGNPGPAASAFIVKDSSGHEIFKQGFYLGVTTNNQAEYTAVIKALEWLIAIPPAANPSLPTRVTYFGLLFISILY